MDVLVKKIERVYRVSVAPRLPYSRVVASIVSSTAVTAIRAVSSLVTVPFILHSYGNSGLAVWLLFLSFSGLISYFGTGLSSATITDISHAHENERGKVAEAITAAFFVSLIMAAACVVCVCSLFWTFDLYSLLNAREVVSRIDFNELFLVLAGTVVIEQLLFVPKFALIGLGEGYKGFLAEAVGRVLSGVTVIALAVLHLNLKWPLASFIIVPALAVGLTGYLTLRRHFHGLEPSRLVTYAHLVELCREAFRLAVAQAAYGFATQTDLTLISIFAGPLSGVKYGVAQRLFAIPMLGMSAIATAVWPEISSAYVAGRRQWIRRWANRGGFGITLGGITMAAILICFYRPITTAWLRNDTGPPDKLLLFGMAAWLILACFNMMQGTVLRAMKDTKMIMRSVVLMAFLNVPLSIVLIQKTGAAGAIWGSVIAILVCMVMPYRRRMRHMLDDLG